MSPTLSPHQFLSPLTSFFQDIGLHHRHATHHAFEIKGKPLPDRIGNIWQAKEAAIAFEEGNLRSIPIGDSAIEGDSSVGDDSEDNYEHEDDTESDDEDDDDDGYHKMGIIFRNESPAPLVLCWLSQTGDAYHFYRLEPSSSTKSKRQNFEKLDTDHLENTFPGHAFCLGYVQGEEEISRVQRLKSLFREEKRNSGLNGTNKSSKNKRIRIGNNHEVEDCNTASASSIVVAGYRPFVSKPPLSSSSSSSSSSGSSSASLLVRHVQLITITHVAPRKRHLRCLRCFRILPRWLGERKRLIQDDDSDSDRDENGGDEEIPLDPSGWRVSARWVRLESEPYDTTDKVYEECALGGWPCKMEPNWSNGDETSAQKLERDIRVASLLLPPHARDFLRKHCKIWVNRSLKWGPRACPVRGYGCCYHPGKEWLARNGLSGEKHMCVEVNDAPCYKDDCDLWGIGGVMLHELSHAYHHGMLPGGYDNQEIQKCYELAMKEGLYDSVEYHSGIDRDGGTMKRSTARAYACSNAMEYFAELSAAFLGGLDDSKEYNKWYPFNRKQIQTHDPRAYSLLSRLWKVDANLATTKTRQ